MLMDCESFTDCEIHVCHVFSEYMDLTRDLWIHVESHILALIADFRLVDLDLSQHTNQCENAFTSVGTVTCHPGCSE